MGKVIILGILVFIAGLVFAFAQEDLTVSAFYPSPAGVYDELKANVYRDYDQTTVPYPAPSDSPNFNTTAGWVVDPNGNSQLNWLSVQKFWDDLVLSRLSAGLTEHRILFQNTASFTANIHTTVDPAADLRFAVGPPVADKAALSSLPDRMTITNAGNVGIGTTTPQASKNGRRLRLDVKNNIVTNDVYLRSPRSGSPRWASKQSGFGAWQTKTFNTAYTATTDGFVVVYTNSGGDVRCTYDIETPVSISRQHTHANHDGLQAALMSPVRNGDTWIAKDANGCGGTPYWISFGP